jgi:LuxR family maltose regulon positive regulatory protein
MATQPLIAAQEMLLLRTKLYIPPFQQQQVPRPRLIERLDAGLERKLTLVSAPAGFGKTTLVSEWIASHRRDGPRLERRSAVAAAGEREGATAAPKQVAWLSLDEGDNDPTRFLTYLIAALQAASQAAAQAAEPNLGNGALSALHTPQSPPTEAILTSLINELADLPDRIVLVLDDYQRIDDASPASAPIHDALTFLLEHLPPPPAGLHLVIATREDPPLPLARLRARGELTELRAAELRFTSSEAAEFLNQVMGLELSAEDIAALETRTEGWIAGLQLAALALQGTISTHGRRDATRFIQSFTGSHRFVLDYLAEEVLKQQPESVQNFLLQTAILDRLTGSLCDAVTDRAVTDEDNGRATLETLEHANLFIVPLDEERRWYRYHRLFADLLRQRLRQIQPEQLPILHIRAGEWFTRQGLSREAIKHSLAARDYQGAAELIRAIAVDIMQQGEHTTVAGWINALPEGLVKEQPYLCALHAWILQVTGQLETAKSRLIDAENALDGLEYQDGEDVEAIHGLIHSRRAYHAFMIGEMDQTIYHAHQALDQLPETAVLNRTQAALFLGIAYRHRGQLQAALDIYHEILPLTQRMGVNSLVGHLV